MYVAGPISKGDVFENIHHAMVVGRDMVLDGLAPYVPHFDAYLFAWATEDVGANTKVISWKKYLEWDLEWVLQSEAVYRLVGESKGADLEVSRAQAHGIPVFHEAVNDSPFEREMGTTDIDWPDYDDLLLFAELQQLRGATV